MREIKFRLWCKDLEEIIEVNKIGFENNELWYIECIDHDKALLYFPENNDHVLMQYTGLKDKNGKEIYEKDITELEVDGEVRRFVVGIKTVIRNVVSHPSFDDETAKVAITGVVFEWNGFELFPCVDENGVFDNSKMIVVGNIHENPELLGGDNR